MTDATMPRVASSQTPSSYEERFAEAFRQPFWRRFGPVIFFLGTVLYLVYAAWFFDVGNVIRSGHWERAGLFLSDWISWTATAEFRTSSGAVTPRWPKFSPLGDDPQPDWVITNADGTTTIEVTGKSGSVTMSTTDAMSARTGRRRM
jgi:phosphonate transport system permease protein